MEFGFGEETAMIQKSAERFFREQCPLDQVKEWLEGDQGYSRPVWEKMVELGWMGMAFDENDGGAGWPFFDFFILFEEMGKVVLPSPFFCSVVLAGLLIQESGDENLKKEVLPEIIEGQRIMTAALLNERGLLDMGVPNVLADETGNGGYSLNGTSVLVPFANVAEDIIVYADSRGPALFRIDPEMAGSEITPLNTITGQKYFAVTFKNLEIDADCRINAPGGALNPLSSVLAKAVTLKCGEMLGGMGSVLDMTLTHAKERHQFGRPLGSLQVLQHYCADMETDRMTSQLLAYQAASLLSDGIPCEKEISMAKAWCGDAYRRSTWTAHQIHGGIGFTDEHHLHLFYKHAKECELILGDAQHHRSRISEEMVQNHLS
jgi:alkylation response protein AidB-like acyl-CoA dehydrogenase